MSGDSPQEPGSSERSPQSSSRSHVHDRGMQRPLAHEYWLGGHVRAGTEEEACHGGVGFEITHLYCGSASTNKAHVAL